MDALVPQEAASIFVVDEQSRNSNTPSSLRSNRHKRKRLPKAASTPISNYESKVSSVDFTQYHSTLDETWIHDTLFAKTLKHLEKLEHSWTSGYKKSCQSFICLATVILQCSQGKIPDDIPTSDFPVEALVLLRQDHAEQGTELCQGFALERQFSQIRRHLDQMQDCMQQLTTWRTRLTALCNLLKDQSISPQNTSIAEYRAQLILWPAVLGETGGLLTRLERDMRTRNLILSQAPSSCQTAREAHRLSLIWRHLGTLLHWNVVIDMMNQILAMLEQ